MICTRMVDDFKTILKSNQRNYFQLNYEQDPQDNVFLSLHLKLLAGAHDKHRSKEINTCWMRPRPTTDLFFQDK